MAKKQTDSYCEVFDFGNTAYLAGSKTAILFADHKEMIGDSSTVKGNVEPVNAADYGVKDGVQFAKKGTNDKQAVEIMDKIFNLSTLGSNVAFNSKMAYGDGIMVVKKERDPKTNEIQLVEQLPSEQPDIFKFLEENNYIGTVQEWGNDIVVFNETYCEFVFARGENKIVEINPIESTNSRLSIADDKTGEIMYHGHSLKWHEGNPDDVKITPALNRRKALMDLRVRRGLNFDLKGKKATPKKTDGRYVLQLMLPTPGRYYYGKPYWWAIFVDWYEFALAIPKFKKALLQNQMVIKFHVKISKQFWAKLFESKQIAKNDVEKQAACRKQFLIDMDKFLSGEENAGKSFVSEFEYDKMNKYENNDIIITPIDSGVKGGEYLEDSSEVTNIICYAMEIHPSIIGATGKTGSINGTEARELFIIKQSLQKPIRDLFVLPLYIAKNINGWDPDIHFVIPNIMLTTLDKNTGAEKVIGNQKI